MVLSGLRRINLETRSGVKVDLSVVSISKTDDFMSEILLHELSSYLVQRDRDLDRTTIASRSPTQLRLTISTDVHPNSASRSATDGRLPLANPVRQIIAPALDPGQQSLGGMKGDSCKVRPSAAIGLKTTRRALSTENHVAARVPSTQSEEWRQALHHGLWHPVVLSLGIGLQERRLNTGRDEE